jgi:hypothetical protein
MSDRPVAVGKEPTTRSHRGRVDGACPLSAFEKAPQSAAEAASGFARRTAFLSPGDRPKTQRGPDEMEPMGQGLPREHAATFHLCGRARSARLVMQGLWGAFCSPPSLRPPDPAGRVLRRGFFRLKASEAAERKPVISRAGASMGTPRQQRPHRRGAGRYRECRHPDPQGFLRHVAPVAHRARYRRAGSPVKPVPLA